MRWAPLKSRRSLRLKIHRLGNAAVPGGVVFVNLAQCRQRLRPGHDHRVGLKGGADRRVIGHVTEGGIGSLVAETMADAGVGKRLMRLGLKDTYAHGGSRAYLARYYGLDALALVRGVERLLGQDFGLSEADLDAARVDAVHSLLKAEAL